MPLMIVGIGASAGGLEAIAELLGALPPVTGMAYVVVQHLDPKHESLLAEILAKKTAIPVSVALAGEIVQPDRVYVIPPDVTLTVVGGRIDLNPRPSTPERPLPVDALFRSLADYADTCFQSCARACPANDRSDSGCRDVRVARRCTPSP